MTLGQLQERKDYWQARLNLKEWRITATWGPQKGMKCFHGMCWWNPEELIATIQINRMSKDKESILVHELLHIVWQGHADVPDYDIHIERAINRTADALLRKE